MEIELGILHLYTSLLRVFCLLISCFDFSRDAYIKLRLYSLTPSPLDMAQT